MPEREGIPLSGGYLNAGRVTRLDHAVLRQQGHPWPRAVSQALDELQRRGFTGCPRELKRIDDNTVMLTYVTGYVPPDPIPTWVSRLDVLDQVTDFIASFSLAAEGIPTRLHDQDWLTSPMNGNVFVHGDPHPTNVVFDEARQPTGLIDFELATVGSHLSNLISLVFTWAPLEPVRSTSWRLHGTLDPLVRVTRIVRRWPRIVESEQLAAALDEYIAWRKAWISELAIRGNAGALRFRNDPSFHDRYDYARLVLLEAVAANP